MIVILCFELNKLSLSQVLSEATVTLLKSLSEG